jgi:outer membrane autotransporter protein
MMTLGSTSSSFDDNMRSINPQLSDATGSVETHAQSIGGYWTKYLPDGTYFDGVGQFTHYYNKYSDIYGDGARQHGFGAATSGEVGKPFKLGSSNLVLEPQAQLVYQYLHLSGTSDEISPISGTSTNGLRGRVGVRLFRPNVSNDSQANSATFYVTADVLHDFLTPNQTTVSDTPFRASAARSWYDLGAGVTMKTGRSSVLYFNVKYARNLGGEYQRSVFGQVGYRYSW